MTAEECARRINAAMTALPKGIALEARVGKSAIEVVLTVSDARGPRDIKEQELPALATAAARVSPERFDAFLAATARWLGAQEVTRGTEVYPHDVFVLGALSDARLVSAQDFHAALTDPVRRDVFVARAELGDFFERHGLSAPDDDALRAMYALTPEGRATKGIPESVRAVRWLASSPQGRRPLVAMMRAWADEPYDPWDVAWEAGPGTTALLLCGAWRHLDPVLGDDALRRAALDSLDRLAHPVAPSDLARAGF